MKTFYSEREQWEELEVTIILQSPPPIQSTPSFLKMFPPPPQDFAPMRPRIEQMNYEGTGVLHATLAQGSLLGLMPPKDVSFLA